MHAGETDLKRFRVVKVNDFNGLCRLRPSRRWIGLANCSNWSKSRDRAKSDRAPQSSSSRALASDNLALKPTGSAIGGDATSPVPDPDSRNLPNPNSRPQKP